MLQIRGHVGDVGNSEVGRTDSNLMELRCIGGDCMACYVFEESAKC